jgi:hypothetical protein
MNNSSTYGRSGAGSIRLRILQFRNIKGGNANMSKQKSRPSSQKASVTNKPAAAPETTSEAESSTSDVEETSTNVDAEASEEKTAVKSGALTAEKPKVAAAAKTTASPSTKAAASAAARPPVAANAAARSGGTVHRPQTRDGAKYERRQANHQMRYLAQKRARRNRVFIITSLSLIFVIIAVLVLYIFVYNPSHTSAQVAATPTPFQEAIFDTDYPPVDNVYCDALEGSVEHIHVHLSIYINGTASALPENIGIPTDSSSGQTTCFYWLHVHPSPAGIIHIEAPVTQTFLLGQFLDIWNQQFSTLGFPTQLLLNSGWTIWVNGKIYKGSLTSVPLDAHNLITIAYGSTTGIKPDTSYNWGSL